MQTYWNIAMEYPAAVMKSSGRDTTIQPNPPSLGGVSVLRIDTWDKLERGHLDRVVISYLNTGKEIICWCYK